MGKRLTIALGAALGLGALGIGIHELNVHATGDTTIVYHDGHEETFDGLGRLFLQAGNGRVITPAPSDELPGAIVFEDGASGHVTAHLEGMQVVSDTPWAFPVRASEEDHILLGADPHIDPAAAAQLDFQDAVHMNIVGGPAKDIADIGTLLDSTLPDGTPVTEVAEPLTAFGKMIAGDLAEQRGAGTCVGSFEGNGSQSFICAMGNGDLVTVDAHGQPMQ